MNHCTTRHDGSLDDIICHIVKHYRRIAVVGFSNKPWRPSFQVGSYLIQQGYEVIPVNPDIPEVLGLRCHQSLSAAPRPAQVVDIFRRGEHIPGIVDEAIAIGAEAIWMQSGLIDEVSAERARRAGLLVVMDRCIMVEHRRRLQRSP